MQTFVRLDASVGQGRIFVAAEGKDGLVYVGRVENAEIHEQIEVLNGQSSDGAEQARLDFGDDIVEGVLAEICKVHERWNASSELDQLLLNRLSLGLVLFLLRCELLLLYSRDALTLILFRFLHP